MDYFAVGNASRCLAYVLAVFAASDRWRYTRIADMWSIGIEVRPQHGRVWHVLMEAAAMMRLWFCSVLI